MLREAEVRLSQVENIGAIARSPAIPPENTLTPDPAASERIRTQADANHEQYFVLTGFCGRKRPHADSRLVAEEGLEPPTRGL